MNDRLLEVRKTLKISQEQMGKKLGVTRSSISNMETGRFSITDTMIKLICSEFSVSEEWLRTGEGEMFVKIDTDKELATLFADFAKTTRVKQDPFVEAFLIEIMKFMTTATEEEWEPIKLMIKRLAATLDKADIK